MAMGCYQHATDVEHAGSSMGEQVENLWFQEPMPGNAGGVTWLCAQRAVSAAANPFMFRFAQQCVFGRLLQLSLARGDGRRHARGLRRGEERLRQGDRGEDAGNTTDRAEAYRQFRGSDPEVRALLK